MRATISFVTFVAALAACTGLEEGIDSTEVQWKLAPGELYSDPDYVAGRLTDLALLSADRLRDEEIEALYAGEITSQDALDLGAEEHAAVERELRALTALGVVLAYYCLCEHCQGGMVNKICLR